MTSGALPGLVSEIVDELVGHPFTTLQLGGMSGARVMRSTGPSGSVVVKAGAPSREAAVYRSLSPVLAAAGIRIPALYRTVELVGESWLMLEDLRTPLPRHRWLADPEVLAILDRLHRIPAVTLDVLPSRFQPRWTEAMTDEALRWLGNHPDPGRGLAELRAEAAPLFEPRVVISGDPNPLNWGLSDAGELVLMDWERIGLGHPAIDVAITVPGLPTLDEFERTVVVYRSIEPTGTANARRIVTRQLVLAKLWTVIDLLADTPPLVEDGHGHGHSPVARRQETAVTVSRLLSEWLRRIT